VTDQKKDLTTVEDITCEKEYLRRPGEGNHPKLNRPEGTEPLTMWNSWRVKLTR